MEINDRQTNFKSKSPSNKVLVRKSECEEDLSEESGRPDGFEMGNRNLELVVINWV